MKVEVSTKLNAPASKIWAVVKTKKLLFYVMSPLASFKLINDDGLKEWQEGKSYIGKSFLFNFLPLGQRTIFLELISELEMIIQSREFGEIGLKKWDHKIIIKPINTNETSYTDIIEIDAGIFTIPYYLFATVFYKHRQSKWQKLVSNDFKF